MKPVALDEFPVHQAPVSMRHAATTDRNFYDRCYFNAHDRTGEVFLITGLGVYRNLGVIDAFATVRVGDRLSVVRFSDALDDGVAVEQRVGPYRIEVIEPLWRVRLVCEGKAGGIGFDLTWQGSFPAVEEQRHVLRHGSRTILDATRFAQVGTWSGELLVEGSSFAVDSERWVGTRDRSWGSRPVGEAEPAGRPADPAIEGFWWLYVPLRFDDFAVVVIVQEEPSGYRTLNDAVRVWPDGRVEQLGWLRVSIAYRPGSRHPQRATLAMTAADGRPVVIDVTTLAGVPLHVGSGYGSDPDWNHGQWKGPRWTNAASYDLTDPEVQARAPFGVIDHIARAVCDGQEGWGLFEHASIGRHDPSGFGDFSSVAE